MVDTIKISELPAVVTADGTSVFPVVQGGVTKKESINQVAKQIQNTVFTLSLDTGVGANVYIATLSPSVTPLTKGLTFYFVPNFDNSGPSTININGTGVKAMTNTDGTALAANEMVAGGVFLLTYDGTAVQILNPRSQSVGNPVAWSKYYFTSVYTGIDDVTSGEIINPYLTVPFAMTQIPTLSGSNPGDSAAIVLMGGAHVTYSLSPALSLKPNVSIITLGNDQAQLSSDTISLDATYDTTSSDVVFDNQFFNGQISLDAAILTSGNQFFKFSNCNFNGGVTVTGQNGGIGHTGTNGAFFDSCIIQSGNSLSLKGLGDYNISSQKSGLSNCQLISGSILTLQSTDSGSSLSTYIVDGLVTDDGSVISITKDAGGDVVVYITNSSIRCNITVDGVGATLYIDDASCPTGGAAIINNTGGTVVFLNPKQPQNEYYVAAQGSDTVFNGSLQHPAFNVNVVQTVITPAPAFDVPVSVILGASSYDYTDPTFNAYVNFSGAGLFATRWNVTGTFSPNLANWSGKTGSLSTFSGFNINGDIDFDFTSISATSNVFYFDQFQVSGTSNFTGDTNGNSLTYDAVDSNFVGIVTADNVQLTMNAGAEFTGITMTTVGGSSVLFLQNAFNLSGTIDLTASGGNSITGSLLCSSVQGNFSADGNVIIYYDAVSYPQGSVALSNGAQLIPINTDSPKPITESTTSHTYSRSENRALVVYTNSGAITATIDGSLGWVSGDYGLWQQQGTGVITFVGSGGANVVGNPGVNSNGQYSQGFFMYDGTNFVIGGNCA